MAITIDQLCSICCSNISEKDFPTYQFQLSCAMKALLQLIVAKEECCGCVCYEFAVDDIRSALRILERGDDGNFTGNYRYIDSTTGDDVLAASIVECPGVDCAYFSGV